MSTLAIAAVALVALIPVGAFIGWILGTAAKRGDEALARAIRDVSR